MVQLTQFPRSTVISVIGDGEDLSHTLLTDALTCADPELFLSVDFRHCTYVDARIVSALYAQYVRRRAGFEVVIPPEGTIHRVFAICGCLEFFARTSPACAVEG